MGNCQDFLPCSVIIAGTPGGLENLRVSLSQVFLGSDSLSSFVLTFVIGPSFIWLGMPQDWPAWLSQRVTLLMI